MISCLGSMHAISRRNFHSKENREITRRIFIPHTHLFNYKKNSNLLRIRGFDCEYKPDSRAHQAGFHREIFRIGTRVCVVVHLPPCQYPDLHDHIRQPHGSKAPGDDLYLGLWCLPYCGACALDRIYEHREPILNRVSREKTHHIKNPRGSSNPSAFYCFFRDHHLCCHPHDLYSHPSSRRDLLISVSCVHPGSVSHPATLCLCSGVFSCDAGGLPAGSQGGCLNRFPDLVLVHSDCLCVQHSSPGHTADTCMESDAFRGVCVPGYVCISDNAVILLSFYRAHIEYRTHSCRLCNIQKT